MLLEGTLRTLETPVRIERGTIWYESCINSLRPRVRRRIFMNNTRIRSTEAQGGGCYVER